MYAHGIQRSGRIGLRRIFNNAGNDIQYTLYRDQPIFSLNYKKKNLESCDQVKRQVSSQLFPAYFKRCIE